MLSVTSEMLTIFNGFAMDSNYSITLHSCSLLGRMACLWVSDKCYMSKSHGMPFVMIYGISTL